MWIKTKKKWRKIFLRIKKRVMDCDDCWMDGLEASWSWLLCVNERPASTCLPERPPSKIYFCIFVITCYNQLIDIKIYMIKRRWNAKKAARNQFPETQRKHDQLLQFFLYEFKHSSAFPLKSDNNSREKSDAIL